MIGCGGCSFKVCVPQSGLFYTEQSQTLHTDSVGRGHINVQPLRLILFKVEAAIGSSQSRTAKTSKRWSHLRNRFSGSVHLNTVPFANSECSFVLWVCCKFQLHFENSASRIKYIVNALTKKSRPQLCADCWKCFFVWKIAIGWDQKNHCFHQIFVFPVCDLICVMTSRNPTEDNSNCFFQWQGM